MYKFFLKAKRNYRKLRYLKLAKFNCIRVIDKNKILGLYQKIENIWNRYYMIF